MNSYQLSALIVFICSSFVSSLFVKTLASVSGTSINLYLKKKGREPAGNGKLEYLESCEELCRVVDQLSRLGVVFLLSWYAVFSAFDPAAVVTLIAVLLAGILIAGELVPVALAHLLQERLIVFFLPVLLVLGRFFSPFVEFYERAVRFFVRIGGGDMERHAEQAVEEEILSAVEEGEREGLIRMGGKDMIESIISFYDVEVKEVMTPRTSMLCLPDTTTFEEGIAEARKCGHSRIPVYRENKDNIIGILYVKDFLKYFKQSEQETPLLDALVRKAYFVPESKKVSELFQEFRSQRFHIAVVLDEYGGTLGLITIEDILEEIVGEIEDEYENMSTRASFLRVNEKVTEVAGTMHVDELNEYLGMDLPDEDSYETLAGFLFHAFGRIPEVGETITRDNIQFEIIEANERQITTVRIKRE